MIGPDDIHSTPYVFHMFQCKYPDPIHVTRIISSSKTLTSAVFSVNLPSVSILVLTMVSIAGFRNYGLDFDFIPLTAIQESHLYTYYHTTHHTLLTTIVDMTLTDPVQRLNATSCQWLRHVAFPPEPASSKIRFTFLIPAPAAIRRWGPPHCHYPRSKRPR